MKIFIVRGEHPHDPYYPLEPFMSEASATARAVELTAEFLKDWWDIHQDDTPLLQPPAVTAENWESIIDEHGEDDSQDDGFGNWWVSLQEVEVKP